MNRILPALTKITDKLVATVLSLQNTQPNTPYYGGFILPEKGFNEFAIDAKCMDSLLAAYYAPDSEYYQKGFLLDRVLLFLDGILLEQHDDGTFDLKETNFHDATLTGFMVQILAYTYRLLLLKTRNTKNEIAIQQKLTVFFQNSAHGLINGGFHTPNHRWVMASALSLCWNILGDDKLKDMALRYLSEGIDCDENGEYTERSTGVYNVVNNRSLFIISQELELPDLREHIARNLRMVFTYIEPDDTLFTLNSTRQDNGTNPYPFVYFESYLMMACLDRDAQFAFMADSLLTKMESLVYTTPPLEFYSVLREGTCISKVLLEKRLQEFDMQPVAIPETYHCFYKESGIVRDRNKDVSYTILANNETFFVLQKGLCQMQIRYASAFFAKGVFVSKEVIPQQDGYLLEYRSMGDYKRPFENPPPTGIWSDMDHASRQSVHRVDLLMQVFVKKTDTGVRLRFCCNGVKNLPAKIEISFPPGGIYESGQDQIFTLADTSVIMKNSSAKYQFGVDQICINGGRADHCYTKNMRGTPPHHSNMFTIYMTTMGNSEHEVSFE